MADNVDDDDANLELDEEIDHQVQAEANQAIQNVQYRKGTEEIDQLVMLNMYRKVS